MIFQADELADDWDRHCQLKDWEIDFNEHVINFGAIPMPPGYAVLWSDGMEMYQGVGPDGGRSLITWSRFAARDWCVQTAKEKSNDN